MEQIFLAGSPYGSLSLLLWCAILGAGVGAVFSTFARKSQGVFVKRMRTARATDAASAVTLSDIGLNKDRFLARQLKEGKPLARYVRTVQTEGEPTRYYLPEETRYEAEIRYDLRGTDLRGLSLALLLLLLLGVAMQLAVPYLTTILSGTFSSFGA